MTTTPAARRTRTSASAETRTKHGSAVRMQRSHMNYHCIDHDGSSETGAVFAAAAGFGLTPDEQLRAVAAALDRLPPDVRADCIDELAGAFGARLIDKERARDPAQL
jgi:hypothetical protein